MVWARMLAYITGTVDQELLLRNEYLAAENRILKAQIKGRLLLSGADKATLAEIALSLVTILSGWGCKPRLSSPFDYFDHTGSSSINASLGHYQAFEIFDHTPPASFGLSP